MASRSTELLVSFIEELPNAPAHDLDGALEIARTYREPAPGRGRGIDEVLARVSAAAEKGFNTAGPGYLAYIPGGGLFAAALADYLSLGLNRYVGVWNAAPALAQIEATVIRWLCDLFDYPAEARGILTSGGSMANFSAIVAARRALLPEDFLSGTVYGSSQLHASVSKAAVLAGFPARNVRSVPTTPDLRLDVRTLERMVAEDRAAGLRPFLLAANAGSTNTGAVDPLRECAEVAARGRRSPGSTLPTRSRSIHTRGSSCRTGRGACSYATGRVCARLTRSPPPICRTWRPRTRSRTSPTPRPSCRATSAAYACGCP